MMFFGTGGGAMWFARKYPFGTTLSMGPGYFPMVLGALLMIFGGAIILRGTLIGAFFGVLPGTGPSIASFSSYMVEKKVAKDPSRY